MIITLKMYTGFLDKGQWISEQMWSLLNKVIPTELHKDYEEWRKRLWGYYLFSRRLRPTIPQRLLVLRLLNDLRLLDRRLGIREYPVQPIYQLHSLLYYQKTYSIRKYTGILNRLFDYYSKRFEGNKESQNRHFICLIFKSFTLQPLSSGLEKSIISKYEEFSNHVCLVHWMKMIFDWDREERKWISKSLSVSIPVVELDSKVVFPPGRARTPTRSPVQSPANLIQDNASISSVSHERRSPVAERRRKKSVPGS